MSREEEIRLIAYCIWEEEDCCHGHDVEHWLKAELIWETQNKGEKQKRKSVSKGTKTESKQATKPKKKNTARGKKP
jgi:prophage tail gpP-like protein